jgi:hypothetical protein
LFAVTDVQDARRQAASTAETRGPRRWFVVTDIQDARR